MFRKHNFYYTWDAVLNTGPIYFNLVQNIGNDWKSSALYHESICGNDLHYWIDPAFDILLGLLHKSSTT